MNPEVEKIVEETRDALCGQYQAHDRVWLLRAVDARVDALALSGIELDLRQWVLVLLLQRRVRRVLARFGACPLPPQKNPSNI